MKAFTYITLLFIFALNVYNIKALEPPQGIDTVYFFTPGEGQNAGQSSEYFPNNIFGLPFSAATDIIPASTPSDLCSIGFGGEIIVGFKGKVLIDGNGPDFTIFENVMKNDLTSRYFVEPAIVSVSYDGINYIEFPFDTLTLEGCAGTKPTYGAQNPFDPSISGGNSFDLATIGIAKIKYIKIKDFSQYIYAHPEHPFYDPTLSGFDLDALVGINLELNNDLQADDSSIQKYSLLSKVLTTKYYKEYKIYSISGELISQEEIANDTIYLNFLQTGIYFIELLSNKNREYVKYTCY
jgi:hypothetical protein